jgi:hypothetical protein
MTENESANRSDAAPRPSRAVLVALLIAATNSVALIVAGFVVPMYSTVGASSSPTGSSGNVPAPIIVTRSSTTLVAENGLHVVFLLLIPLIVTVAVWAALLQRTRRGALTVAWILSGLLALFNLATLMTIGLYIIPVSVSLLFACSRIQPKPKQGDTTKGLAI